MCQILRSEEHVNKYYIKQHERNKYVIKCFGQYNSPWKTHFPHSHKWDHRNNPKYFKRLKSKCIGRSLLELNELKTTINDTIIAASHHCIQQLIAKQYPPDPQSNRLEYSQATTNNTDMAKMTENGSTVKHEDDGCFRRISATVTLILGTPNFSCTKRVCEDIYDHLYSKETMLKLKQATINVGLIDSNIIDSYEVYTSDSINIQLPIKTLSDYPVIRYMHKSYTYHDDNYKNLWKNLDGRAALKIARECIKMVSEERESNEGIIINKSNLFFGFFGERKRSVIPITFDFESLLFEFIPSNDIIENILAPYLGYDKFYHCIDNLDLKLNECHEPYFNLLPLSCKLSRLLFNYLPSNDILCQVLIPLIGYDLFYYILIDNGQEIKDDAKQYIKIKHEGHTISSKEDINVWWDLKTCQDVDSDTEESSSSADSNLFGGDSSSEYDSSSS